MMRMFRSAATVPLGADPDPTLPADADARPSQKPKRTLWQKIKRGLLIFLVVFVLIVAWLAFTAPLSNSLEPINAPSLTILSAEGEPIARRGAAIGAPAH